ncbi:hypothetical protein KFU94_67055 [Chloroflexi bacterium TSY]|nr:hypothetical protein [Chloroflexi bacterium TSY]
MYSRANMIVLAVACAVAVGRRSRFFAINWLSPIFVVLADIVALHAIEVVIIRPAIEEVIALKAPEESSPRPPFRLSLPASPRGGRGPGRH